MNVIKQTSMVPTLACLCIVATFSWTAASGTSLEYDEINNWYTGATGVLVQGISYDVAFKFGQFTDVFGGPVASDRFHEFSNTDGFLAADALAQIVRDDGRSLVFGLYMPTSNDMTSSNFVATPTRIERIVTTSNDITTIWGYYSYSTTDPTTSQHWDNGPSMGYAVWSPTAVPVAVPEPSTTWLFGSGLLGLVLATRRKAKAV